MAKIRQPAEKAGKKRKHDDSSVVEAGPSKKVKASGLDFAERSTRHSPRLKSRAVENTAAPASNAIPSTDSSHKEKRSRSERSDRKNAQHAERKELKRQKRREQKKANKILAKKNRAEGLEQYHDAEDEPVAPPIPRTFFDFDSHKEQLTKEQLKGI